MASNAVDIVPFVSEITTDMIRELEARFSEYADLDAPDRDAIVTAVSKAAWLGILRGAALLAHSSNAQEDARAAADPDADTIRLDPQLRVDPTPDLWAKRYGDDA